jgi:hypothetical protein
MAELSPILLAAAARISSSWPSYAYLVADEALPA